MGSLGMAPCVLRASSRNLVPACGSSATAISTCWPVLAGISGVVDVSGIVGALCQLLLSGGCTCSSSSSSPLQPSRRCGSASAIMSHRSMASCVGRAGGIGTAEAGLVWARSGWLHALQPTTFLADTRISYAVLGLRPSTVAMVCTGPNRRTPESTPFSSASIGAAKSMRWRFLPSTGWTATA